MRVVRVQIVAGHRLMADSLVHGLSREPDLFVLPHRRPEDLTDGDPISRADVAIIDASSTAGAWPQLAEVLGSGPRPAGVIVLADVDEAENALVAARAGVRAWIRSTARAPAVAGVVRAVASGRALYPPELLATVLDGLREDVRRAASARDDDGPLAGLTEREREVLVCLIEGRQSQEIADELDVAPNTVRTHTNRIFRKLGVHSRLEAVRIARHAGLAPRPVPDSPIAIRASIRMSTPADSG